MTPEGIIERITSQFEGVIPKASWGETSLFYNPNHVLPNGVYFCTIKEKDGKNDQSSELNRNGVFRVSMGIGKPAYQSLFGKPPKRPTKGCIISTNDDFTQLNTLMPHPIYGWISWVQILNPSVEHFEQLLPLIEQAHQNATVKFTARFK